MAGRRRKVRYIVPKLINGRGTIPIDRSFKSVGRIRMVSGTTDEDVYRRMMDTLDDIYDVGNLATLEALRNGSVTMMEVYSNAINKGVTSQMTVNLDRPLMETINDWLPNHNIKASTRKTYRDHLSLLFQFCSANDMVRDLPKRLDIYYKSAKKRGIGTTFNRARAAVMAFARVEYRNSSSLYLSIKQVPKLPETKKNITNALGVEDIVAFTEGMYEKAAKMVWAICFSGLRIGELLETNDTTWETTQDLLMVYKHNPGHGNKGYTRTVMLPFPLEKPLLGERQFRRYLDDARQATGLEATSHTFRKCFTHWMELSGIPRTRRRAYLGHGNADITDIYEKHDVTRYLRDDATAFRDFVEERRKTKANLKAREFFDFS